MNQNLLFIKHREFNARTVDNDLTILNEKYNVKLYNSKIGKGLLSFPVGFIFDFLFLVFNILKFKVIFIWFSDYHAFLPSLFSLLLRKKCIICLGGYDAHWYVPDKAYSIKEKFRKFCVIYSIKFASVVLPVSNWLASFVKHLKIDKNIRVAYCCVNPELIYDLKDKVKENLILTVGGGGILYETKRKKLDFFIEVGNYFYNTYPSYNAKFFLIGHEPGTETYNYLVKFIKSPNVKLISSVNDPKKLSDYFSRSKAYCQFSEYEAFGIAIIEAMINRSVPIVYNGGAMPEVVGDTGLIITEYNIEKTAEIVKDLLDNKYEFLREEARKRVFDKFTVEKRKEIIYNII